MERKKFIGSLLGLGGLLTIRNYSMAWNILKTLPENGVVMPVLFMGHGNPMNAIEENEYTKGWREIVKGIPTPKAIMCVSAHWETKGTKVTAVEKPKMIYDMYGFPDELYRVKYDCPGAPEYAEEVTQIVKKTNVMKDLDWGLDHGTWSVLVKMYPNADIPCFQLSIDHSRDMQYHYDLAKELQGLRKKGVLIVGSGNIVHNLRYARFGEVQPYDWALEFDEKVKEWINNDQHDLLIHYQKYGKAAELSVNSAEHYIPLLYVLATKNNNDSILQTNEAIAFGSGSMRCVKIGA